MSDVKLCKDCKHYEAAVHGVEEYDHCLSPQSVKAASIRFRDYAFCAVSRRHEISCGESAKFYEPKTEEGM